MKEINAENPEARLIQTEDMGFTRSTEPLQYQADFENERRFLSFDLLTGKITEDHPLREYLLALGALPEELDWFREHARSPDVFGLNYYVTSERFIDHRVDRYPAHLVGGNDQDAYADVEAVRACEEGMLGPKCVLQAVYSRYRAPVALTEAHLGAEAEERACWLSYLVREAIAAKRESVDVRAVCVWALLGSYGWRRLVCHGYEPYEAGVFEMQDGVPRKTLVAEVVRALCHGDEPRATWLPADAWWERPDRIIYPPYDPEERVA
jgi:dTDP-4-dehydrorhamnose reductase